MNIKVSKNIKETFPYLVPNFISNFEGCNRKDSYTLSISNTSLDYQAKKLIEKIVTSQAKKKALPILRLSDGEYTFLFGYKRPVFRNVDIFTYTLRYLRYVIKYKFKKQVSASTRPGVSSGNYTFEESTKARERVVSGVIGVASNGYLALHTTYATKPFQEAYHADLVSFLRGIGVGLSETNYIPFYIVYALFQMPDFKDILCGKSLTIVTHASLAKKQVIEQSLMMNYAIGSINWIDISQSRSLYDRLAEPSSVGDFIFVAAGIGKFNIFSQLLERGVHATIIDVGYMLEVWANPAENHIRPYTYL